MFSSLQDRLSHAFKKLAGKSRLTEKNIDVVTREVKKALLEADVGLPVVKNFIHHVRKKALGETVQAHLQPDHAFIKIVQEELTTMMGEHNETLDLKCQPPAVILMAGLQGSGKTTTVAKLARFLTEKMKKSVLVTSADIYRPSAIEQLHTLAEQIGVECFPSNSHQAPLAIAQGAIKSAKKTAKNVVIIDTAGRTAIDEAMMTEIKALHKGIQPIETLFVVDSMTGQDAVNTAKAFNDALPLTGVILTKCDGDARGGAALSLRAITGKPIKFLGMGEKTDALSPFYPDRVASQILGMGDLLSLVEDLEANVSEKEKQKAEKLAKKVLKGQGFNLEDFRQQLQQMKSFGGVSKLMSKMPGMGQLPAALKDKVDDKAFIQKEAIINSMTMKERQYPHLIKGSRLKRIAAGSGTQTATVNRLLKEFTKMQKMMKKFSSGGMMKMMSQMKNRLPSDDGKGSGGLPF